MIHAAPSLGAGNLMGVKQPSAKQIVLITMNKDSRKQNSGIRSSPCSLF